MTTRRKTLRKTLDRHDEPSIAEIRVHARRERVKELMVRRRTAPEIAEALHVSERTVREDFAAIRAELAEAAGREDAITVASDFMIRAEARQRELWGLFAKLTGTDARTVAVKVVILRELRAEAKDEVEALQKLGIVYQAPREVMIGIQAIAALRLVPEDQLEALAMLPQPQFLQQLAAFVGEQTVAGLLEGAR